MQWLEFEHEVRHLVEAFGYEAETTTPSHDFGVDVFARNHHHHVVIQCKLYGKSKIGGPTIMNLLGSRHYHKATDAICITTSSFTKQAKEIAAEAGVKLIDKEKLVLLCQQKHLTIPSLTVLLSSTGENYSLGASQTTLGKHPSNNIILPSPYISQHHAVLHRKTLHLIVEDCASTNGTYVNGGRIAQPVHLNYFDEIRFADTLFTVALSTPKHSVT